MKRIVGDTCRGLATAFAFAMLAYSPTIRAAEVVVVKNVAEFTAAVKTVEPGDYVTLANGEWRDAELVVSRSGTVKQPLNIRAETWGKVVLTGKSRLRIGGDFVDVAGLLWKDSAADDNVISFRIDSKTVAHFSTVRDCAILGDLPEAERKWVSLYGNCNAIRNCRFEGKQSPGTLAVVWLDDEPNRHSICNNFFGSRSRLGKNGGEILRIGDSKTSLQKSQTSVHKNYFYRCDGEAEIISNKSCGNFYVKNVFVGCSGALTLRHGNDCEVRENDFFGDDRKGTGGVRIIGEGHRISRNLFYELTGDDVRAAVSLMNGVVDSPLNGYLQVQKTSVYRNTFFRCRETIVVGLRDDDQQRQTLPPTDCSFSENAVVAGKSPVFVVRTVPQSFRHEDNTYVGEKLGIDVETGWRQVAVLPKPEKSPFETLRMSEVGRELTEFVLSTRPTDVGPEWFRPGDELLPEVLKPKWP